MPVCLHHEASRLRMLHNISLLILSILLTLCLSLSLCVSLCLSVPLSLCLSVRARMYRQITGAYEADGSAVHFNCAPASGCQWGNYDKLSWLTLNTSILSMLDMPTIAVRLTLRLRFVESQA